MGHNFAIPEDQFQYSKLIVLLLEGVNGDIRPFKDHLRRLHLTDNAQVIELTKTQQKYA